uniref:BRX domain-containing protein n=1 Tax=Salix viminalis TaxID=40686 RepID=A0A6N2MFG3_SALVM
MLTCIACSKQLNNGSLNQREIEEDVTAFETPRTKQAIKALTAQDPRTVTGTMPCLILPRTQPGSTARIVEQEVPIRPRMWERDGARLKGLSSGEGTPASISGRTECVALTEEDEPKEWVAQVEPGVLIAFLSLPDGGNDLKRIRFSGQKLVVSQLCRKSRKCRNLISEFQCRKRTKDDAV